MFTIRHQHQTPHQNTCSLVWIEIGEVAVRATSWENFGLQPWSRPDLGRVVNYSIYWYVFCEKELCQQQALHHNATHCGEYIIIYIYIYRKNAKHSRCWIERRGKKLTPNTGHENPVKFHRISNHSTSFLTWSLCPSFCWLSVLSALALAALSELVDLRFAMRGKLHSVSQTAVIIMCPAQDMAPSMWQVGLQANNSGVNNLTETELCATTPSKIFWEHKLNTIPIVEARGSGICSGIKKVSLCDCCWQHPCLHQKSRQQFWNVLNTHLRFLSLTPFATNYLSSVTLYFWKIKP